MSCEINVGGSAVSLHAVLRPGDTVTRQSRIAERQDIDIDPAFQVLVDLCLPTDLRPVLNPRSLLIRQHTGAEVQRIEKHPANQEFECRASTVLGSPRCCIGCAYSVLVRLHPMVKYGLV
ncbi:hypothetical protein [Paracoccus sp. T5]|uniref:hypothetical protein n=1 Tax=Paracoccus sp. T5 TaxID=3402161 RepID=UPI003ADB0BFE